MTKKISSKDEESEVYQRYLNELLSEKEELKKFKAIVTEDTNFLSYTVDLTDTANKDITVNYKLDTLLYDINYKETSEGWTCK